MERSELAIIIPAYNEEKSIVSVIDGVKALGIVIVVNDCSKDNTHSTAEGAGAIVVNHHTNKGYDGALNSGFEKALALGAKYGITIDADGQHKPDSLLKYVSLLDDGYDMVLGVRPSSARFAEALYAVVARLLWGIRDPLCGMKGYRLSLVEKNGGFDTCRSIGTELAIQSVRRGCKFSQVGIPILNRQDGTPRFGNLLRANLKIFKAMLRVLFLPKQGPRKA